MKSLIKIFSFLLFLTPLFSQQLYENQIIPFDGRDSDWFGSAVAVSDSFLFISSLRYSNQIENAVYVYRLIGDDYEFIYKIHPSDGQPGISGSLFGSDLLYSDGQLFVGAQNRSINNIPVGAVYLFEYENYIWVEKQIIIPPEPHTFNGLFSNSISKYNDYLLIGADRYNSGNYQSGKVFLYKFTNGNYGLYQEFVPFDAKDDQFYGTSVEIKENIILIGSGNDSSKSGLGSGSVYTYIKEDSIWTFSRKYFPEPNSENLSYGSTMAANEDYVFVGTADNFYYNKPGKVYIYKYSHPVLGLSQIIETGDNYYDDRFGTSVFAKGDSLLVGAISDTVKNSTSGATYLFVNERGNWSRKHKIFPSDGLDGDWFGIVGIITDEKIIIGAPLSFENGIDMGKAYLFTSYPLGINEEEIFGVGEFYLSQNYPNPFNPKTRIDFYIPKEGKIKIKVYDIKGSEIKTVLEERKYRGHYKVDLDLNGMPTGVYFYRSEYVYEENNKTHHSVITKKAVFIK
jgi:hypothetical protein